MMKVRVTARFETYLEGETMSEIRKEYDNLIVGDNFDFVEMVSVEDADTYEDLWDEWCEA